MTIDTVQDIDRDIANNKPFVAMAEALERLKGNRDFKDVILKGYLEDEAIRLVHLKADPQFQTAERQQAILADINAIGALNQYFQLVFFKADQANKAIASSEQLREELLLEGGV